MSGARRAVRSQRAHVSLQHRRFVNLSRNDHEVQLSIFRAIQLGKRLTGVALLYALAIPSKCRWPKWSFRDQTRRRQGCVQYSIQQTSALVEIGADKKWLF